MLDTFGAKISLLLDVASPYDEVVIKVTSPGGAVTTYGHAAAQMLRLRKAGVKVTCCVDTVAASGGYMMACVADRLVASPFAFLGSIGVVSGMPNFYRVMQKNEIDYMMFTAGKFKRTVHPLTKTTEQEKEKFKEQLDEIHDAFQQHVHENRNQVDMEKAGTGEAWIASQAMSKGETMLPRVLTRTYSGPLFFSNFGNGFNVPVAPFS